MSSIMRWRNGLMTCVVTDGLMACVVTDGLMACVVTDGLMACDQRSRPTNSPGCGRHAASGGTEHFVYDEAGHLTGRYSDRGKVLDETAWLGDLPVAVL